MKISLILALSFLMSSMAYTAAPNFEQNRFLVKIKKNGSFPETQTKLSYRKLYKNLYVVETSNFDQAFQELKKHSQVALVEKSYRSEKHKLEVPTTYIMKSATGGSVDSPFDDPKMGRLWAFKNTEHGGMNVNRAYIQPLPFRKEEIIVAVVDTGVDYNHQDLKEIMWVNTGEIPGNNIDDDLNGYIDDVHGIDTLTRDGENIPSGDPRFSHPHGTHVAGTIAAQQNNALGIAGVASHVKIMAVRAVPDQGDETDIDVVESFLYAAKNGAKIINCSFGKKLNEGGMIVSETIDLIGKDYDVLVVAAAGNNYGLNIDDSQRYPASFVNNNLMVIAALGPNARLAGFSNVGARNVDIAAPGVEILSTIPSNQYAAYNGTSMATPNTVGVLAEIWSQFPHLSALELKALVMDAAYPKDGLKGKMVSSGMVDLYESLKLASEKY